MLELNRVGQCPQHHLNHWLKHLPGRKGRPEIVRLAHPARCLDRRAQQTAQNRFQDQGQAVHFHPRYLAHERPLLEW